VGNQWDKHRPPRELSHRDRCKTRDTIMTDTTPNKRKAWLRDRLRKGRESTWSDATRKRFDWRTFDAHLVEPGTHTNSHAQELANDHANGRERMSEALTLDLLSICIRGRDMRRRGKPIECWLRAQFLRRIIERVKPSREGFDHNKYGVAMSLLCRHGLAQPDPSGANGYEWTGEYSRLTARAEWLLDYAKREGEVRRLAGHTRYELTD
jgi:hypothetical protein